MKRFMLCAQALALCLCVTRAHAQYDWNLLDWHWVYPLVQGKTLNDMDVMLPTSAIAVGVEGTVIMTTDRGQSWLVRPVIPGHPDLNAVSAITPSTIVAVGNNGLILRSTDGAGTWDAEASGTTADLHAVDFHGLSRGIAVGAGGTILRSVDAGVTWLPENSGTSAQLHGVRMVDALTAIAVGAAGTILKTTDGGVHWVPQTSGMAADLFDVDFYGSDDAIAVGAGTTVLITVDGGANWSPPAVPVSPSWPVTASAVDMSAFPTVVVAGVVPGTDDFAVLMRSGDGGATWGVGVHIQTAPLSGVAMFTSAEGVAIGAAGTIRRTTDGALSWPQIAGGQPRFWTTAVDFLDPLHGAVSLGEYGGQQGTSRMYVTADGGVTWAGGPTLPNYAVADVSFADANTVYAVGRGPYWQDVGGTIWRNGVIIYSPICWYMWPACTSSLNAVDFAGPDVGVAVGDGGGVVTIFGGVPELVLLPMVAYLNGVSVPTPEIAYAVGDSGVVFKGDLVGGSWTVLASGTTNELLDVCFIDALTGWIVGGNGTILFTPDGGDTWVPQASGTTMTLTSVSFIDAGNGLIGTGEAAILKTQDGGDTWVPEDMPFPVADVDFVDPVCAVAAASNLEGVVMHRVWPVPVFFQDVSASASAYAVDLRWDVYADEALQGFRVYRSAGSAGAVALTGGMLAPVARSFLDRDVVPGGVYAYTVVAIDERGDMIRSLPVRVSVPSAGVTLLQNKPNPFNPATHIRFSLPSRAAVTLVVFDVAGRRVATLVDDVRAAGEHDVTWNGRDSAGSPSPSGVYFYELRTERAVIARKMMLLK